MISICVLIRVEFALKLKINNILLDSVLSSFTVEIYVQGCAPIEYGIFGEGSHILTSQKRENGSFSILIVRNIRPFPENTVPY